MRIALTVMFIMLGCNLFLSIIDSNMLEMIDGMDHKTMWSVLDSYMMESYDKYTDEELIEEVKEYYPELLEEN